MESGGLKIQGPLRAPAHCVTATHFPLMLVTSSVGNGLFTLTAAIRGNWLEFISCDPEWLQAISAAPTSAAPITSTTESELTEDGTRTSKLTWLKLKFYNQALLFSLNPLIFCCSTWLSQYSLWWIYILSCHWQGSFSFGILSFYKSNKKYKLFKKIAKQILTVIIKFHIQWSLWYKTPIL